MLNELIPVEVLSPKENFVAFFRNKRVYPGQKLMVKPSEYSERWMRKLNSSAGIETDLTEAAEDDIDPSLVSGNPQDARKRGRPKGS